MLIQHEVQIPYSQGMLSGVLLTPPFPGQHPEVVLLSGSTHHPEQAPVMVTPHSGHPLSDGSTPFTMRDEHYFMAVDDPEVDVFVTTSSDYGEQPAAWRRMEGNGRVAVLTPGHNVEVWLHPSFQKLLLNSLRWCGKFL